MDNELWGRTPQGEGAQRAEAASSNVAAHDAARPISTASQEWPGLEIDGEATLVPLASTAAELHVPSAPPMPHMPADQVDDIVVLLLPKRALAPALGEVESLTAGILNNGDRSSVFTVQVEGNVDPAWFPDLPLQLSLHPGERKTLTFQVNPPRLPTARAGDHACAVVVHAAGYPGHSSRAGFVVSVPPYAAFRLGALQPEHLTTSWWERSATATLSLTNLSNFSAGFQLAGADRQRLCAFEFETPDDLYPQVGRASLQLEPGESALLRVTVMPRRLPFASLFAQPALYRVGARLVEGAGASADEAVGGGARQIAQGRISASALLGPWQMAGAAGLAVMALIGVGLAGLLLLLALRVGAGRAPVAAVAEEPPVVTLLLNIDEPLPTRAAPNSASIAGQAAGQAAAGAALPGPLVIAGGDAQGLPVIQPDQITAPGQPAAAAPVQPRAAPAPSTVNPGASGMTYAQMFQEVALRYDLDWRQLAAQGYVESGFDALAMGSQGSLGLMQIHPATWQEWAPAVGAGDPFDSYSSVLVAAVYLDYLRATLGKQGYPQAEWMLAAYNWGPDKVLALLASGGAWDDLPAEVRDYAADVLRIAQSIPAN